MKLRRIISLSLILIVMFNFISYSFESAKVYAAYKEVVGKRINYALGATATADDEEKSGSTIWEASKAIDGIVNRDQTDVKLQSRWSTNRDTSIGERTLIVDFGTIRSFDKIILEWERNNAQGFYISVSTDGINYNTVHTRDSSLGNLKQLTYSIEFDNNVDARYVKLGVTKYVGWENVSLYEIMILGEFENMALSATASASGCETTHHSASKAIDGIINRSETVNNSQSRWSSNVALNENKWIALDFGKKVVMESAVIEWERLNATAYKIQYSNDNSVWTDVKTFDSLPTEFRQIINFDTPIYARYLRLLVTSFNEAGLSFTGSYPKWKNVSVWEFEVYPTKNLAYDATITANASEGVDFAPTFANDGIVNPENTINKEQSRWASSVSIDEKWLELDFGSQKRVASVVIEWERLNATSYKLQYSNDNSTWTDIKSFTQKPMNFRDTITFPTISTRYLRLVISDFEAKGSVRNGSTFTWKTVSVYEFEAYPVGLLELTLSDVASTLKLPEIDSDDTEFKLPEVPSGFNIELIGADYEQIIDKDHTIHTPIVDTKVNVNFKLTKGNETLETEEYEVTVPGKYTISSTDNDKPVVIPELAEWKGHTGNFIASESSRIVVNPDYKSKLSFVCDSFKKDYENLTGNAIEIIYSTSANKGDFYFTLGSDDVGLKEEGYIITIADFVTVEAVEKTGAFWAVQSIIQILDRYDKKMPKGITRDYPKFKVRGFMLDVGRKPFTMSFLYEVVKTMAYYKLNDFGVHLNDNYIWVEQYNNTETDQWGAYSAFRLESDIKKGGLNQADLTSTDLYYTKDEFREFIQYSRKMGVNVVPEIDTPAHALALTKVRPDLAMKEDSVERWADHMDLSNPETEEFVKSIWNEYMAGETPVFDKQTILNIGTDEYEGNNNDFRQYSANMINFVQNSGRTVRMWGSLTRKSGSVSVPSENVQLYIWNTSWSNPEAMYKAGYEIINIQDSYVYIVPNGTNNRGAYKDRLDLQSIYENWTPNTIGSTTIPSGSDKILGGAFAIWNDNIDLKENGLGEYDLFDRFFESAPYIATKAWGDGKDMTYSQFASILQGQKPAPNTNPYHEVKSKSKITAKYIFEGALTDISGNGYNATGSKNTSYDQGSLVLSGGKSYVTTPLNNIGPTSSISFRIKAEGPSVSEQVLFESENASIKAYQKKTGKFGYSRDNCDYSFNYTLPKNQWVEITVKGYLYKTELYVNGVLTDTLSRTGTGKLYATGVLPIQTIGSKTKAFFGVIDEITIENPNYTSELWSVDESGKVLTISKNLGDFSYNNIPWYEYCESIEKVEITEDVTEIGSWSFKNLNPKQGIYYYGTEEQFKNVAISQTGNSPLLNSEIIFIKEFKIRKASVTINESLSVNFKIYNYLFETEGYQNPVITVNGNQIEHYTIEKDFAVFTFDGIGPHKMVDTLSVTLSATKNGETFTDNAEFIVSDYLMQLIELFPEDEKLKVLAVDALNYGAAAQIYKNYKTDTLANALLSEEQKIIRDAGEVSNCISITDIVEENAVFKSHALYLEDSLEIKLTFKAKDSEGLSVIVTDSKGKQLHTITELHKNFYGEYYFYFDDIPVYNIDEIYNFTIAKDGVAISETLSYSISSYISKAVKVNSLENLAKALLAYGRSAYNYKV